MAARKKTGAPARGADKAAFDAARTAFLEDVQHAVDVAPAVFGDPRFAELAVPGWFAFEATRDGGREPARGWARSDGSVVRARRQNFGPVLEALGALSRDRAVDAEAVARRIAWSFGAGFERIDAPPKDVGRAAREVCPPCLRPITGGGMRLTMFVRYAKPKPNGRRPILEQVVEVKAPGSYRCGTYEIWPTPTRNRGE
jgi:hypothetical protein